MKTINWTVREYMETLMYTNNGLPIMIDEDMLDLAHYMHLDFDDIENSGDAFLVNHLKGALPDRVTCEEAILNLWGIDENNPVPRCHNHTWISSGVPGGSAWCKVCNVEYENDRSGVWEI